MTDNLILFANGDTCPIIEEPIVDPSKIINFVIVGIILWLLIGKK